MRIQKSTCTYCFHVLPNSGLELSEIFSLFRVFLSFRVNRWKILFCARGNSQHLCCWFSYHLGLFVHSHFTNLPLVVLNVFDCILLGLISFNFVIDNNTTHAFLQSYYSIFYVDAKLQRSSVEIFVKAVFLCPWIIFLSLLNWSGKG